MDITDSCACKPFKDMLWTCYGIKEKFCISFKDDRAPSFLDS